MGLLHRTAFWASERARHRPTRRLVAEMAAAERLSPEALRAATAARLRAFCARVAREVPHYGRVFAAAGLEPDGIRSIDDLRRLPLLDKEAIRAAGADLFHPAGGPYRTTETGGSTGDPLKIHDSPLRQAVHLAARIRSRAWWGIPAGEPELVLFGGAFDKNARGLLHRVKDELIGSVTYPAFGMTEAHLDELHARMRSMRPRHVFGYSSALCAFARHLRAQTGRSDGGADCGVDVVFTTSEMLLPADRALLAETFGAGVADGYGSKEGGFIAHQCAEGAYHARTDTHVLEVLRDGEPLPMGEAGELVVTFLGDWHWPFVRYRTGDSIALLDETCSCGLPLPLVRLAGGRVTDLLTRRDGALVHGLGAIYPIRETPGVARFQIHQKSLDEVEVLLVIVPDDYPENGDAEIARRLGETLGGPRVVVRHVPAIDQAASGKYRVVRSDIAVVST